MIIADRQPGSKVLFETILSKANKGLSIKSAQSPTVFINMAPQEIEESVFKHLCDAARGTSFDGKILWLSGHAFPDITANQIYGVEVKSSKNQNWKSTGNSVLESTRVKDIKYIYICFAKLSTPVQFKYRSYQDCLSGIAITHSPRYLIDMQLEEGESIFSKMGITYDELRAEERPLRTVTNYFRSITLPGEEPWWLETEDSSENNVPPTITLFNKLSLSDKQKYLIEMFARFPELLSHSTQKYQGPASYLAARHGVVSSNIRDHFTAGGKVEIRLQNKIFCNLPQVYQKFHALYRLIVYNVQNLDPEEAKFYWQIKGKILKADLLPVWKQQILADKNLSGHERNFLRELLLGNSD